MKIRTGFPAAGLFALTTLLLGGCSAGKEPAPAIGIANPASVYCVEQGGRLEIVDTEAGQVGMGHLPDGSVIEEWELFRRDNPRE